MNNKTHTKRFSPSKPSFKPLVKIELYILVFFLFLSIACNKEEVEQIEIDLPKGLKLPANMAYIPAGEFIYGHAEHPKTALGVKVTTKAFFIDIYEMSRGEYALKQKDYQTTEALEKFPLTEIDFFTAKNFCKSLGKRLPTEKEWEKAARGPDGRKWPWLNFKTHPNNGFSGFLPEKVDQRLEWISPYGVYGMGHNVWEWVDQDYDYNGMPDKDRGQYKVIRGGLFQSHLKIDFSASYARNFMLPKSKYNFLGFRCVKDLPN